MTTEMRTFESGATRHSEEGKLDFEGFFSPHVLKRYAEYLNEHRVQADGKVRTSDNWQQGIPLEVYMKSALRHTMDWWGLHRERTYDAHPETQKAHEDALCAVMFNAMGYLFELIQYKNKVSERDGGAPPREALEDYSEEADHA